ncbi:dopamine receptor 2 [Drosophila willistoni]|uniref:dopamine receptor 2 n=1 Tax=Drosophila willistoni TaxID=7260 RepID=UPI000C26C30C|nr:dopamine receptor 2 [Drosophila willistoni]
MIAPPSSPPPTAAPPTQFSSYNQTALISNDNVQTMLLYTRFLTASMSPEDSNLDNAMLLIHSSTISNNITMTTTTTTTTTATILRTTAAAVIGVPSVNSYIRNMSWPKSIAVAVFLILILITVIGNTLVILAVLTTRRLRTVTNCFVMNLAITDWLVGTCVMPPSVILYITGVWRFGWILCDIWISLDILLSTGSILSLCAISLDRYLAVTQPLTYSKKRRSKRLALLMILVVWITALSITCPPYLGWYEPGRHQQDYVDCRYNQNKGYVVFSAMGSFFIPLTVMLYVYVKIGYVLTSRRQRIVRDANSERTADYEIDGDHYISESEHYHCTPAKCLPSRKSRWRFNSLHEPTPSLSSSGGPKNTASNSLRCSKCSGDKGAAGDKTLTFKHQPTFYELVEVSRLSSLIHCSAMSCKYGGPCIHGTPSGEAIIGSSVLHYNGSSQASFSDTCLGGTSSGGGVADGTATTTSQVTTTTCTNETTCNSIQAKVQVQEQEQELESKLSNTQLQKRPFAGHHEPTYHHHQHHHHAHSHSHPHTHSHSHHGHSHSQSSHGHQQGHNHRVTMRVSTTKRDTKTAKTLTIVMGGLIACWMPFFVYYLLIPFLPRAAVLEDLMYGFTWIGWVNCAINPFIYAFYNPDFRTAFWRLTCRRICKPKRPPNHLAMFRG